MKAILFILMLTVLSSSIGYSQSDTLVLKASQLGYQDIETKESLFTNLKVLSASKTLKEVSELPFSIQIITKEEILKNGYTTLVDVLKMLPGVRISQPGSALEGETFLMRGLKGNTYARIMINGIEIKPFGVLSTPIGAQLPIRQAERIEVIYGPAAALYGADANAGVINIIIEETLKPLYTQAHLSVGTNGYTNVDVMFGGRLGKDKNILKFNFFGSSTNSNDKRTTYDQQILYDPSLYSLTGKYALSPNFREGEDGVIINNLPHESRMIGFSLSYKMFKAEAEFMARKDHTATGLHPAAVSYFNPSSHLGERILNSKISISKAYDKFSFESQVGYKDYYMDPRSSTDYVTNTLFEVFDSAAILMSINPVDPTFNQMYYDSMIQQVNDRYFSRTRFSSARNVELYTDHSINFYPYKFLEFSLGGQFSYNSLVSQVNYVEAPIYHEQFKTLPYRPTSVPFRPRRNQINEGNLYSQLYLTFAKFNFIGGMQLYHNSRYGRSINPRYAVIYKANSEFSVRAFYGEAFRTPTPFYNSNSYIISPLNEQPIELFNNPAPYKPEKTKSFELGLRWSPGRHIGVDLHYFYTKTDNLITSNWVVSPPNIETPFFILGYFNNGDAEARLSGIQTNFTLKRLLPQQNLNINFNLTYSSSAQKSVGNMFMETDLLEAPEWIAKARIQYSPFDRFSLTTDHIFMSAAMNGNEFRQAFTTYSSSEFYTMDFLLRYELNRHFNIYFKLNNVFDKVYAGLNATNTPDDLIFNPQELRTFRLGMNYRMN